MNGMSSSWAAIYLLISMAFTSPLLLRGYYLPSRSPELTYDAMYYWQKSYSNAPALGEPLLQVAAAVTELNLGLKKAMEVVCMRSPEHVAWVQNTGHSEVMCRFASAPQYTNTVVNNATSSGGDKSVSQQSSDDIYCPVCSVGECYPAASSHLVGLALATLREAFHTAGVDGYNNGVKVVPDLGSVLSSMQDFERQITEFAKVFVDDYVNTYGGISYAATGAVPGPFSCLPFDYFPMLRESVARQSNVLSSKLHVLQVHLQETGVVSPRSPEDGLARQAVTPNGFHLPPVPPKTRIVFHEDLGVHRTEILPELVRRLLSITGRATGRTVFRYLEVGVLDGETSQEVLNVLRDSTSEVKSESQEGLEKYELHLVDPFGDAEAEYFHHDGMTPGHRLAERGASVSERFAAEIAAAQIKLWKTTSRAAVGPVSDWLSRNRTKQGTKDARAGPEDAEGEAPRDHDVDAPSGTDLFDMVFLDGDHSYAETLHDLSAWTPLVRIGGVVAIHDYSGDCEKCEYDVVRAMHEYLTSTRNGGGRRHVDSISNGEVVTNEDPLATLHTSPDVLAWFYVARASGDE